MHINEIGFWHLDSSDIMTLLSTCEQNDWLHCQSFILKFKGFQDNNWESEMTVRWTYYSSNFWKICNIIGAKFPKNVNKLIGSQYFILHNFCEHIFS